MTWDEFVALPELPSHPVHTPNIRFPTERDPFSDMLYSYGTPGAVPNQHLEFIMRALTAPRSLQHACRAQSNAAERTRFLPPSENLAAPITGTHASAALGGPDDAQSTSGP